MLLLISPSAVTRTINSKTRERSESRLLPLSTCCLTSYQHCLLDRSLSGSVLSILAPVPVLIFPDSAALDSEDDEDEEDAWDLREVSSDVEMHPDDVDGLESDGG